MSAQTPIYGITYPTESDLVRDVHQHMQTVATTVESALHEVDQRATPAGSTPVIATTFDQLSQMPGVVGQTGYVTGDVSYDNGMYVYNGSAWTRGSVPLGADVFDFHEVTNWAPQYRAWLSAGTVHLSLRLNRKTDMGATSLLNTERVGNILIDKFKPPYFMHMPAFTSQSTTNNPATAFGIQIQPAGGIWVEALQNNVGIKAGGNVQAMITWPCAFN